MNPRRLTIAWDNSLAGANSAGTGAYASGLLGELARSENLKIEVLEGWNRPAKQPGLFARGIKSLEGVLWTHFHLPRLLRRGNHDVLHSPAFVAPLNCPCPNVVTIHDLTFRIFPGYFERGWRCYLDWTMPSVLRAASAVVCVSQQTKLDLLKYYKLSPDKARVIYNGVDHARFNPAATLDSAWAQKLGLQRGYVLHVGALSHRKNIPTLLRAIAHLRSNGKWRNRQLVLAGPETSSLPGAAAIHQTIRELDLGSSVLLTGRVPDDQMPGLYAHASVLVMPSLYEGFGFPVLEGMAAGTPVVASNTSSLPEVAGDAAILTPPLDVHALAGAIRDVIENPSLTEELRRKGITRAGQFSWHRAAAETIAVYRTVAAS